MTTITLPRATAQQALEAMRRAVPTGQITLYEWDKAMAALRAALAQQAEPDAYGYASRLAVAIWEKHYKDTAPHWKPLDDLMGVLTQIDNMAAGMTRLAQQAEPVAVFDERLGRPVLLPGAPMLRDGQSLYTAPPQRKPLTDEEIERICAPLGFAQLSPVEVARSVERAHNITDPQVADRLARHGIPMPGDPK